jgi:predicted site-specific integrase-resolvase
MSKTPKTRPKTYSTPEAAKLIGVSVITLHRWLAAQKIQPYGIELGDGRKLWRWNERDIAEGRKLKASQKYGPKTKP